MEMNIFLILGSGSFLKQDVEVFIFEGNVLNVALLSSKTCLLKDILKSKKSSYNMYNTCNINR